MIWQNYTRLDYLNLIIISNSKIPHTSVFEVEIPKYRRWKNDVIETEAQLVQVSITSSQHLLRRYLYLEGALHEVPYCL